MADEYHLGQEIRKEMQRHGMTATMFADRLCLARQSVYDVFKKRHCATDQLAAICGILDRDFFKELSEQVCAEDIDDDSVTVTEMMSSLMPDGHFDEAVKMAKEGAKQSEPRSMYFLALSYERKADFPTISPETKANYYQKAAKLCLWAAEIGYIPAMRRINKYIHEGILTPDTKLYLELLVLTARYNTRCRPRHQQNKK